MEQRRKLSEEEWKEWEETILGEGGGSEGREEVKKDLRLKKRSSEGAQAELKKFLGELQGEEVLDGVYAAGVREGVLKKLVVEYKYQSRRGFKRTLAEALARAVPDEVAEELKREGATIVPLPTIGRHIRERGFDHTGAMAKELAKMTGLAYFPLLKRVNKTTQVGADSATRQRQASEAYAVDERFSGRRCPILLVDDIWTTGASMKAAALKLKAAGFEKIYGVVVAVSPGSVARDKKAVISAGERGLTEEE